VQAAENFNHNTNKKLFTNSETYKKCECDVNPIFRTSPEHFSLSSFQQIFFGIKFKAMHYKLNEYFNKFHFIKLLLEGFNDNERCDDNQNNYNTADGPVNVVT
jgi:hypothetical protein